MRQLPRLALLCLVWLVWNAAPAAGADPAKLALAHEMQPDGSIRVIATVTDAAGKPVKGAGVTFLARTAFGWLQVAEADSDQRGRAAVTLAPSPQYPELKVEVSANTAVWAGVLLGSLPQRDPARRPGPGTLRALSPQPGFISPYPPVQILFVAVILGGVWTTYAYLVSLLLRIKRAQ